MLALAGWDLGLRCEFLDPADEPPASGLGPIRKHPFDDVAALTTLSARTDVLTYEFENLSAPALSHLAAATRLWPPPEALAIAQSRSLEKRFFEELGYRVAPWQPATSQSELEAAAATVGLPAIAKLDRLGYDGKGQQRLHGKDDLAGCFAALGAKPLVVEGLVRFERELSIIGTRDQQGRCVCYPLTENQHRAGILHRSVVAAAETALQAEAERLFHAVAAALDYVGTLAIELFQAGGELIINEMAPRVHNSGHWTIEGAATSQFENHLRAVCGLPLGSTSAHGAAGMRNFIGALPRAAEVLDIPGLSFHDYGKTARPGRKLGHATVVANSSQAVIDALDELDRRVPPASPND